MDGARTAQVPNNTQPNRTEPNLTEPKTTETTSPPSTLADGQKPQTPTQHLTAVFCEAVGRNPVSRDYGQIGRLINQHGEASVRYAVEQLTAALMDQPIERPFAWLAKVAATGPPPDEAAAGDDEEREEFDTSAAMRQWERDVAEADRRRAAREARERAAAAEAGDPDGDRAPAAAGAGG